VQVGGAGATQGLDARVDAGGIHEMEHDLHAFAFFAQEVADALAVVAEGQHGGRIPLEPHFVLDAGADHIVAFAQRAVGVDQEFGNDEDRDPLGPFRIAFDARQHRVNDVLGHIVFAVGDEDLCAGDQIGAVGLFDRFCFQRPDIRSGARLRQTHGAAPFPFHQLGDDHVVQFLIRKGGNNGNRPGDGAAIHRQGCVSGIEIFRAGHGNTGGETRSPYFLRQSQGMESGLDIGIEALFERFGNLDLARLGIELQARLVPFGIGRIKLLNGNFLGQFERILVNASVKILEGVEPVQFLQFQHLKQGKTDITRID